MALNIGRLFGRGRENPEVGPIVPLDNDGETEVSRLNPKEVSVEPAGITAMDDWESPVAVVEDATDVVLNATAPLASQASLGRENSIELVASGETTQMKAGWTAPEGDGTASGTNERSMGPGEPQGFDRGYLPPEANAVVEPGRLEFPNVTDPRGVMEDVTEVVLNVRNEPAGILPYIEQQNAVGPEADVSEADAVEYGLITAVRGENLYTSNPGGGLLGATAEGDGSNPGANERTMAPDGPLSLNNKNPELNRYENMASPEGFSSQTQPHADGLILDVVGGQTTAAQDVFVTELSGPQDGSLGVKYEDFNMQPGATAADISVGGFGGGVDDRSIAPDEQGDGFLMELDRPAGDAMQDVFVTEIRGGTSNTPGFHEDENADGDFDDRGERVVGDGPNVLYARDGARADHPLADDIGRSGRQIEAENGGLDTADETPEFGAAFRPEVGDEVLLARSSNLKFDTEVTDYRESDFNLRGPHEGVITKWEGPDLDAAKNELISETGFPAFKSTSGMDDDADAARMEPRAEPDGIMVWNGEPVSHGVVDASMNEVAIETLEFASSDGSTEATQRQAAGIDVWEHANVSGVAEVETAIPAIMGVPDDGGERIIMANTEGDFHLRSGQGDGGAPGFQAPSYEIEDVNQAVDGPSTLLAGLEPATGGGDAVSDLDLVFHPVFEEQTDSDIASEIMGDFDGDGSVDAADY